MNIYSGLSIRRLDDSGPHDDDFPDLYSIGVSLGRMPRFAGHTKELYTVLGHVLTVAAIMPPKYGILGLLHDSQESIVGDVPTPWKTSSAEALEVELQERIFRGYGLKWPVPDRIWAEVKKADRIALGAEAHVAGHPEAEYWWPEYNQNAAEITSFHLQHVSSMLCAGISGPIYEEAFSHYAQLVDSELVVDSNILYSHILETESGS